jgi:hypothetical protein
MNPRIKELEDQASQYASRETTDLDEWEFIFRKKFAELIIGECIHKINDIAESSNNPQPIYRVAVDLLEHFGVE